jgi:RNA polymerase sigma-70 factor (ECF subfamily)
MDDTPDDESEWIAEVQRGDSAACERIPLRDERDIYSHMYRVLCNATAASDPTRDAFIKAYEPGGKGFTEVNGWSWLCRTANNACYDQLRRKARAQTNRGGTWQP